MLYSILSIAYIYIELCIGDKRLFTNLNDNPPLCLYLYIIFSITIQIHYTDSQLL